MVIKPWSRLVSDQRGPTLDEVGEVRMGIGEPLGSSRPEGISLGKAAGMSRRERPLEVQGKLRNEERDVVMMMN